MPLPLPKTPIFCFGYGYVAHHLWQHGCSVVGTKQEQHPHFSAPSSAHIIPFNKTTQPSFQELSAYRHFLISIPPDMDGDIVLRFYEDFFKAHIAHIDWIGYLSATSVYGNHHGQWVDENTPCHPTSARGIHRQMAEKDWINLCDATGLPIHIFRLSGIYGPGRSVLDRIQHHGGAHLPQIIEKPGHCFSRIHVADIVQVITASIHQSTEGKKHPASTAQIYNVADDLPAMASDVMRYGYQLLNLAPPPSTPFEQAVLTPMGRSFYDDHKKVCNQRMKKELGIQLIYPTYKEGLQNCFKEMG